MKNLLYFSRKMDLGGTENVILQLCEEMRPHFNKIVVCSAGGINVKKINDLNIKHYTIPDFVSNNPIVFFIVIFTIYKIIKKEQIDIVHSHHRRAALFACLLRVATDIVCIYTAHNTFENKVLLSKIIIRFNHVIAVGQDVQNNIHTQFNKSVNEIAVIRNAIPPPSEEIVGLPELDIFASHNEFVLCNVGRLSEQKGMVYFIDAMSLLVAKNINVQAVIIGEGELREELEKRVIRHKLDNYIHFLGYRSDIQNIMSQVDVVVLSSLWEGYPLTPIEAFSVGKPVIGTLVYGTREIITHMYDGLLVEPASASEIAASVIRLIEDPNLRKTISINAKKTYIEKFSYINFSKQYKQYYSKLLCKLEV